MSSIAVSEGVVNFVEGVGDIFCIAGGSITSLVGGIIDIGDGVVTGDWSFSRAKSIFDKTMSFVATDYSINIFDFIFETELIDLLRN